MLFISYNMLITRLDQIVEWLGRDLDGGEGAWNGCLLFDEAHRAKNLVPDSGTKPTQDGRRGPRRGSHSPRAPKPHLVEGKATQTATPLQARRRARAS